MVEKGLDEIGPPVLVIEIVGVLPDIAGQEGRLPERDRVDAIQGVGDLELAFVRDKPSPAAAGLLGGRRLEVLLTFVKRAHIGSTRTARVALRYTCATGLS